MVLHLHHRLYNGAMAMERCAAETGQIMANGAGSSSIRLNTKKIKEERQCPVNPCVHGIFSATAAIMSDSAFKDGSGKYIFRGVVHTAFISLASVKRFPCNGLNGEEYR